MSFRIENLLLHPALVAGFVLITAESATAQIFTNLHRFTATPNSTNSDGANPYGGLILSGDVLYGTARNGGNPVYGNGTVFKVNINSTGFTVLHTFTPIPAGYFTNSDGANPYAGLVLADNTLYGTTYNGGASSNGTVFRVNTDGSGFTNLHSFTGFFGYINADGANPYGGLILCSNALYGTAHNGGGQGSGTVFKINTDGNGFTVLHTFTARQPPLYTNADGAFPSAGLILSGNTLYGTAGYGGYSDSGAVFKVNTDGSGFTNLSGSIVANPSGAELIVSGDTLFGTSAGGVAGTIFRGSTNGGDFTNFYRFSALTQDSTSIYTNRDGQFPQTLILVNNILYGTANSGGNKGGGTIFRVNTNGGAFTNLYNFTNSYGIFPSGKMVLSGDTLFGTTQGGGIAPGNGTVFGFTFGLINLPRLTIIPFGSSVILTWPTNAAGFALQSATNLVSAAWDVVSPGPVIVNGSNTVLNPISGSQQFFRLSQ